MSLQMIHEAYKPVYMWSKFFLRANGRTEVFHEALADLKKGKQSTHCLCFSIVTQRAKARDKRTKVVGWRRRRRTEEGGSEQGFCHKISFMQLLIDKPIHWPLVGKTWYMQINILLVLEEPFIPTIDHKTRTSPFWMRWGSAYKLAFSLPPFPPPIRLNILLQLFFGEVGR